MTREDYVKQFLAKLESTNPVDYLCLDGTDWISREQMKDFIGGIGDIRPATGEYLDILSDLPVRKEESSE